MTEQELREWMEIGLKFHGHMCGGMPLGFHAGRLAMETLGVEREPDSELIALAETGEYHLAGCWVDGIMLATGCTYGKGNMHKLFWGKWALTLIDKRTSRAVRVTVKPEVMEAATKGEFLKTRIKGVLPSQVPQEIAKPFFESIAYGNPYERIEVGEVFEYEWKSPPTDFNIYRCEICGEMVVSRHMRVSQDGKRICIPCSENPFDYPHALCLARGPEHCRWPKPNK